MNPNSLNEIEHLNGQVYPLHYSSEKIVLNGKFRVVDLGLPHDDGKFGDLIINAKLLFPPIRTDVIKLVPQSAPTDDDCMITLCDPISDV